MLGLCKNVWCRNRRQHASTGARAACDRRSYEPRQNAAGAIVEILEREGRISRNQCLSMFIGRLAARIGDLEEEGWRFETEKDGGDCVYRVVLRRAARQLALLS